MMSIYVVVVTDFFDALMVFVVFFWLSLSFHAEGKKLRCGWLFFFYLGFEERLNFENRSPFSEKEGDWDSFRGDFNVVEVLDGVMGGVGALKIGESFGASDLGDIEGDTRDLPLLLLDRRELFLKLVLLLPLLLLFGVLGVTARFDLGGGRDNTPPPFDPLPIPLLLMNGLLSPCCFWFDEFTGVRAMIDRTFFTGSGVPTPELLMEDRGLRIGVLKDSSFRPTSEGEGSGDF